MSGPGWVGRALLEAASFTTVDVQLFQPLAWSHVWTLVCKYSHRTTGAVGTLHHSRHVSWHHHLLFPFRVSERQEIPYHRWQSVRLTMIATFVFYGFMHLIFGSREVYPVHFLKTYLFMLSIVGTCVFLKAEVPPHEYLLAGLFFWIAVTLHLASGQRMRRYFSRK